MSRRNSASASHSLLHRYPNVHYALNAYNSAVHHYNQEVRAAAGGLSAPAAPSTRHLDKARADFLAAVATLPDEESRKVYMDEYERTHVERYNGSSTRVIDKKIKSTLRKRHAVKSGLAYNPHTVCQDCGQEDAVVRHEDGRVACFMCGAPQSAIETRYNGPSKRRKKASSADLYADTDYAAGTSYEDGPESLHLRELLADAKRAVKKSAAKKADLVMTPALERAIATLDEEKSKIRENRRRKNATFTRRKPQQFPQLAALQAFYATLNELFPHNTTIIPIFPESDVQPKGDADFQAFVFADYAARVITPIALHAAGFVRETTRLERLPQVVDSASAKKAYAACMSSAAYIRAAMENMTNMTASTRDFMNRVLYAVDFAAGANNTVSHLTQDNHGLVGSQVARCVTASTKVLYKVTFKSTEGQDELWDAVNAMLQAL